MTETGKVPDSKTLLRQLAEERVQQEALSSESLSPEETRRVLHELRVHQIELEMQNEELRRAQVELEVARERYFDLYDLAPVGYVTLSERGLILEANLTRATLLGNSRQALVGQPLTRFILKEDQDVFYRHRKKLFDTEEPQVCELRMVKLDGTVFWAHLEATVAQDAEGAPVCRVALNDITERKQTEEAQRKLDERLSQIQRLDALGNLAAGVAHNMNNVMAVIMGMASTQEKQTTGASDREAYAIIGKACRRGRDVVKSLIQFVKPTLASSAPLELHQSLGEVRDLLKNTTQNRIQIIEAFAGESLWIQGDAGNLNGALVNVCLNAVDAMPNGGTLTFRTVLDGQDWVEVSIEDNGEGMTPEVLAHVTEPFFTTKEVGKGTGLGLSMAYGVIKAHGGTMEISSQFQKGTTVRLRFPRIQAPAPKETHAESAPLHRFLNLLIVDDDEDDIEMMEWMLKKSGGFQVKSVTSGEAALEILRSGLIPDLVILDQNMPKMNGIQTMERIHELQPNQLILIASGQPDIHEWPCFKRPNVAVISKPFEVTELQAKLAEFVLNSGSQA